MQAGGSIKRPIPGRPLLRLACARRRGSGRCWPLCLGTVRRPASPPATAMPPLRLGRCQRFDPENDQHPVDAPSVHVDHLKADAVPVEAFSRPRHVPQAVEHQPGRAVWKSPAPRRPRTPTGVTGIQPSTRQDPFSRWIAVVSATGPASDRAPAMISRMSVRVVKRRGAQEQCHTPCAVAGDQGVEEARRPPSTWAASTASRY